LGAEQLKLLRRFTTEIYIFFDGDEAGRRAADRAFPLCVEAELQGKGVFLPQGYDPDTFVREQGQAKLSELIDRAEPLEDFYFARHAPPPGASAFQRAQAAREALTVLKPMTDIVARGALLTQIAQRFGVNEEALRSTVASQDAPRAQTPSPRREVQGPQVMAEAELIQLMLIDRHAATRVAAEGIVSAFQQWKELATEIITAWEETEKLDLGAFLDRLPKAIADRVSKAYAGAVGNPEEEQERERLLRDCITKIRTAQRRSEQERLRGEIQEAEQKGDEVALRLRLRRHQQKGTAAEED
jgi:DNA primase